MPKAVIECHSLTQACEKILNRPVWRSYSENRLYTEWVVEIKQTDLGSRTSCCHLGCSPQKLHWGCIPRCSTDVTCRWTPSIPLCLPLMCPAVLSPPTDSPSQGKEGCAMLPSAGTELNPHKVHLNPQIGWITWMAFVHVVFLKKEMAKCHTFSCDIEC